MRKGNERTEREPLETFACELCAAKLQAGGREMWPTSEERLGFCQHGQYIHANPIRGMWYGYRTPQERAAARRRKAREKGLQQRHSGGGERARAARGDA